MHSFFLFFYSGDLQNKTNPDTSQLGSVLLLAVSVWNETSTHRLQGRVWHWHTKETTRTNGTVLSIIQIKHSTWKGVCFDCNLHLLNYFLSYCVIPSATSLFVYCSSLQQEVTALSFIIRVIIIIITESDNRRNTRTTTQMTTAVIRHFTIRNTYDTHLNIYYICGDAQMFFFFLSMILSNNHEPFGHRFTLKRYASAWALWISLIINNVHRLYAKEKQKYIFKKKNSPLKCFQSVSLNHYVLQKTDYN